MKLVNSSEIKEELKSKKISLNKNITNLIKTFEEETGLVVSQVLINRSSKVEDRHNFAVNTYIIME